MISLTKEAHPVGCYVHTIKRKILSQGMKKIKLVTFWGLFPWYLLNIFPQKLPVPADLSP